MNCNTCDRAVVEVLVRQEQERDTSRQDISRHKELFREVMRRTDGAVDFPAPEQCTGSDCVRPALISEVAETVVQLAVHDE